MQTVEQFLEGAKTITPSPWDVTNFLEEQGLKVTKYEEGTNPYDDGKITNNNGDIISKDQFQELQKLTFQSKRELNTDIENMGKLNGKLEALGLKSDDSVIEEQRELAHKLEEQIHNLTVINSQSMAQSGMAFANGLAENVAKGNHGGARAVDSPNNQTMIKLDL